MNHGPSLVERVGRASVRWCPRCDRFTYDRMTNATERDMDHLVEAFARLRLRAAARRDAQPARHKGQ